MTARDILLLDGRDEASAAPRDAAPEVVTFGCRLNAYESEVIRGHAAAAGLSDTVIVNTCAVTAEAVRQARQTIRKLRRERPDARLVVTGCAAQIDPQAFAAMPEVDAVVGNQEKMQAGTWTNLPSEAPPLTPPASGGSGDERLSPRANGGRSRGGPAREDATPASGQAPSVRFADSSPKGEQHASLAAPIRVNDIMSVTETAGHLIEGFAERARAYVEVQNGCDHRCTFCIIPYGRGNSRSVAAGAVVAQVRRLAENGYAEVVLTGVDITSWGGDLPGTPKLGRLVRAILEGVPELKRLRLSSLDAVEIDAELYDFVAEEPRVAPHLHLSLQAGDDLILKRMKRRHLRDDAIALCARLKAARPEIAFGADLIAGFPTETEAMFQNTLALVDDCGIAYSHVFPFSPRPGTPAARMPQLDRALVKDRAARLRAKGEAALARHLTSRVGGVADALVEREGFGRLADFSPVRLTGGDVAPGAIARARLVASDGAALVGEIVA
jgi:threonylcarbamoyladenosine tRNA methylthiotransferase MtaB